MRHRLPLLAASIGLVLGGTLAAAYPAAATTNQAGGWIVQPGGPMEGSTGAGPGGGRWAAQHPSAGTGGPSTSASAAWVQPAGTSSTGHKYAAFWVGLDRYSSATVEPTGT